MQTFCSVIADERAEAMLGPYASVMTQAARWQFRRLYDWGQGLLDVRKAAQAHFGLSKRQALSNEFEIKQKVAAWHGTLLYRQSQLTDRIEALIDQCAGWKKRCQQLRHPSKSVKYSAGKGQKTSATTKKKAALTPAQRIARCKQLSLKVHRTHRQIGTLRDRLAQLERQLAGRPAICWGGRKALRTHQRLRREAQALLATVPDDHDRTDPQVERAHQLIWDADQVLEGWQASRSAQFLLVGSKGETAGNQTAQYDPEARSLTLKLPPALLNLPTLTELVVDARGRVTLEGIGFPAAQQKVLERALANDRALTWRFFRDEKDRWRAHVTIESEAVPVTIGNPTDDRPDAHGRQAGRIGVDLNVDHLAIVVIDGHGNPIERHTVPFPEHSTKSGKAAAMVADAVKVLTDLAEHHQIGIAAEDLDFVKKKAALKICGKAHARRLSAWGYAQFREALVARCARRGIHLQLVTPAYTSFIGGEKYAIGYAMTRHHAAALVISRRAQDRTERTVCMAGTALLDPAKAQLAKSNLDRNPRRHRWARWRFVRLPAGAVTSRSGERSKANRQPVGLGLPDPSRVVRREHGKRRSLSLGAVGEAHSPVHIQADL